MRFSLTLFCLVVLFSAKAQTPKHGPDIDWSELDSNTMITLPRPHFYFDTGQPFYTWDKEPRDFEFLLFDRWGNLVAKTNDPHFVIDKIMIGDKKNLKQDVYVAKITLTGIGGVKREWMTHYQYLGFYCSG